MIINLTGNQKLEITPINARVLSLTSNCEPKTLYNEDFEIVELDFYKIKDIKIGDTIEISGVTYNVNKIVKQNSNHYLIDSNLTKSSEFILPLVSLPNTISSHYFYNKYFYNCYLYWDKYPQYSDNKHLFVCYKFYDSKEYKGLETFISEHKNFITNIDPNNNFTIFVLSIPKEYHYAVETILEGKYHELDNSIKSKIINFYELKLGNPIYNALLRPLEAVKKLELKLGTKIPSNMGLYTKPTKESESLIL